MNDLSPVRSQAQHKPKIHFHYKNTPIINRGNKQNQISIDNTPENNNKSKSRLSINEDRKHSCMLCGKQAFYKAIRTWRHYCTQCAIQQMMKGVQLTETGKEKEHISTNHQKSVTSPSKVSLIKLKQPPRELQLEQFIADIEKKEKQINLWLKDSQNHEFSIIESYKQKQNKLRQHYDKINKAIKLSMEADIEFLENSEKNQMTSILETRNNLSKDLVKLIGIKSDIKPNLHQIIQKVQQSKYREFMGKYKTQLKRIQNIDFNKNHSISIFETIQEKNHQYQSEFFRVFQPQKSQQTLINPNSGIFFSFEKKK